MSNTGSSTTPARSMSPEQNHRRTSSAPAPKPPLKANGREEWWEPTWDPLVLVPGLEWSQADLFNWGADMDDWEFMLPPPLDDGAVPSWSLSGHTAVRCSPFSANTVSHASSSFGKETTATTTTAPVPTLHPAAPMIEAIGQEFDKSAEKMAQAFNEESQALKAKMGDLRGELKTQMGELQASMQRIEEGMRVFQDELTRIRGFCPSLQEGQVLSSAASHDIGSAESIFPSKEAKERVAKFLGESKEWRERLTRLLQDIREDKEDKQVADSQNNAGNAAGGFAVVAKSVPGDGKPGRKADVKNRKDDDDDLVGSLLGFAVMALIFLLVGWLLPEEPEV